MIRNNPLDSTHIQGGRRFIRGPSDGFIRQEEKLGKDNYKDLR